MKRSWMYIAILIVLPLIFFYKLAYGFIPVPSDALVGLFHPWRDFYARQYPRGMPFKNFLITDPVRQQIPWRKLTIDLVKQGVFPLWNQYSFSGTPLLGNIQAAVLYPLNTLFLFFQFPTAWAFFIIVQPILGALFMYMYLRNLSYQEDASVFGAITWAFCGFHIAWLTWGTIGHVTLWIPLVLLSVDRIIKETGRKKLHWTLVWCLGMCMELLAGHAQVAFYAILLEVAYALWRSRSVWQSREKIRLYGLFCISGVVILFATWIQLGPFLSTTGESSRLIEEVWKKEGWFLPWQHLVQFIAPDFYGNPSTLNYWGQWNYGEFVGYIGIIGILFGVTGLFIRDKVAGFYRVVTLIAFLFMLHNPISYIPYVLKIPFVRSMQPTRLMVLVDFAFVMLSVIGYSSWKKKNTVIRPAFLLVAMGVVCSWFTVFVLLVNPSVAWAGRFVSVIQSNLILPSMLFFVTCVLIISRRFIKTSRYNNDVIPTLFIVILVFDLFRFAWKFTPFTHVSLFFPETQTISFLKKHQGDFRIMPIDDRILPPNVNMYYGLETPGGYDPIYNSRYETFLAVMERNKPDFQRPYGFNRILSPKNYTSSLFPLLHVRYVLSYGEISDDAFSFVNKEGDTYIYEYKDVRPKTYFAKNVIFTPDKDQVIKSLFSDGFLPGYDAIIESSPLNYVADNTRVVVTQYLTNGRIVMKTSGEKEGILVVDIPYSTQLQGFIDGKHAPLLHANYAFIALIVPEGSHTVIVKPKLL